MRIPRLKIAALGAVAIVLTMSTGAFAIPGLQVYIPGGTYDTGTQTWITGADNFTVWVVASEPLTDVHLTASIGDGEDPAGGSLDIGGTTYTGGDFTYGLHPSLPPHGIFPTNWVEKSIGNMTTMTANTITNFDETYEEGVSPLNSSGQIMMFDIAITGFNQVHFDAWGYNSRQQFVKAPFSHDAQGGGTAVPEPATLLLFGLGVGVAGLSRRRKAKNARKAKNV